MSLYSKYIVPIAVDWACGTKPSRKQREKVVPGASGHVLEIGIGSGHNIPHYDPKTVRHVVGIDPSLETWNRNRHDVNTLPFSLDFIQSGAEDIPADNTSFDTVLITYSMCTIPNLGPAFDEIRRVMKPTGTLIFCEHGKAPDKSVEKWQNRLNPIWKRLGGGCNLNRDIPGLIEANGFKIIEMDTMYIPGWRPASFNYWGRAKIA